MLISLIKWFHPPTFPNDEDKTRSALLLNVVLNTFLFALPVILAGIILGGSIARREITLAVVACAWLLVFGTRLMMLAGRVALAGTLIVFIVFIATTLALYNRGTVRAPAITFYFLAIVIAGLTISRRAIIWTAAFSAIASTIMFMAEKTGGILPKADLTTVDTSQGVSFTVVFMVTAILLYRAVKSMDEALARAREELAVRKQTEAALQRFGAQLETLHEIDRALLSANSLRDIALGALARIRQLIPSPRASISLFDFSKNEAFFLAADYVGELHVGETPITLEAYGQHIIAELQQNKPCFVNDVLTDPRSTALDGILAGYGIQAWLYLPLLYQEQLIGALNLGRSPGKPFTAEDAQIAHDIANQLAIAIQQTNLYNSLQNELAERRQAEETVRKLNIELEERVTERTAELESFSYSISHDLRAPLRAVNGYAGILEQDYLKLLPAEAQGHLEKIKSASRKMGALIDELLAFSRLGRSQLNKRNADLNALTRAVIESLALEIGDRTIEWSLADLPPAQADPTLIQQVFANLMGNAVKYTRGRNPARIAIGCLPQNVEQVYFIRDNGAGFDMKYADKLFSVFQRLHNEEEFEGTGIGLATVHRIITRHGGRIWAEAEPDKGATFYFTLA